MNKPTKSPPHALPAPGVREAPSTDSPKNGDSKPVNKPPSFILKFAAGVGSFAAGIAAGAMAGYYFCKAETKFSSLGENVIMQIWKALRQDKDRGEYGASRRPAWREGPPDFHDRSARRAHDTEHDPMGGGSGQDVPEDDNL